MEQSKGMAPDTTGIAEDFVLVDPSAAKPADRNPAMLRIHGRGSCAFNSAGVDLLKAMCAEAGLVTRNPWGVTLAQDPKSGNPVLLLSADASAQGIPINWSEGGRRAGIYLADGFRAWKINISARKGNSFTIPLAPVTRPSTKEPGLMLRADQIALHLAVRRPAHKPPQAGQ